MDGYLHLMRKEVFMITDNKFHMSYYMIFILFEIVFLFCFISCKKNNERYDIKNTSIQTQYGVKFNPIRQIAGLEMLNKNWKAYIYLPKGITGTSKIDWSFNIDNFPVKLKKPCFFGKTTDFEFDLIVSESDLYTSSNYYDCYELKDNKTTCFEILFYTYYFLPFEQHIIGWSYYLETNYESNIQGHKTKQEADSILNSWGLSRPQSNISY